jgi:periplasmic protein TonB
MKTKHVESLEEMVFRNKNKLYGAYSLRRKYNKYLTLSMVIALFLMLTGFAYPVIASFMTKHHGSDTPIGGNYDPIPPPSTAEPPALPALPPAAPAMKTPRFELPKIVDDSVNSDFGNQANMPDVKPAPLDTSTVDPTPVDNRKEPTIPVVEKQVPRLWVEEMPSFPGGAQALFSFLGKNLKYPEDAKAIGISGKVIITFVVETDGSITEVAVARSIGPLCDDEAVRVVKSMPNWIPGKQNNIPVRVRFNLPVKFILQ